MRVPSVPTRSSPLAGCVRMPIGGNGELSRVIPRHAGEVASHRMSRVFVGRSDPIWHKIGHCARVGNVRPVTIRLQ